MLKEASQRVGAEASDLGELKAPSMPGLKVSPLDRLGSMAAIGAVAAVLANPERQWAQAIEGPPPVIVALSGRILHLYDDFSDPSNDQRLEQERSVLSSDGVSGTPLSMRTVMTAKGFNQVASLNVQHTKSRLDLLLNISLEGFSNYPIHGFGYMSVFGYVYLADPGYRLKGEWSGAVGSKRALEETFYTGGSGGAFLWAWPEGLVLGPAMLGPKIARAEYSFSSSPDLPPLASKATFSGETPLYEPTSREYQGHTYYLSKFVISGFIDTYAGANVHFPWGPPNPLASCSQDANVLMSYEYSIIGGADPEVKLEKDDAAQPLVGSPFYIRAIAKDNDTLGPNPQIRGYEWVNATSVPGDPSRAVVKPTTVGPLTVEVRVIDNEGKTATNTMNLDVEGDQICFYVDVPGSGVGPGHSFVDVRHIGKTPSSLTRGFYPAGEGWAQTLHLFGWGGEVKDDSKHAWDYRLCYFVDEKTRKQAEQFIHAFAQSGTSYNLATYNCTTFVHNVARFVGLAIPPSEGPYGMDDPAFFGKQMSKALANSPRYGDGTIEKFNPTAPGERRRVAPMGGDPENSKMFGPETVLDYLGSNPGALASAWGLRFDSRQLAPLTITAGSTVTLTTPPRDMTNSLSALSWSDSKVLEAQPTTRTKTFSTPGQYSVRFAVVDNFEVWSADIPINVVAPSPTAPPPGGKTVAITPPSWAGHLDIQRFGPSQIRLFAPATGRELLLQRSPKLPFSDSLPWDPFGPSSILTLNISDQGAFFRVRPGQ